MTDNMTENMTETNNPIKNLSSLLQNMSLNRPRMDIDLQKELIFKAIYELFKKKFSYDDFLQLKTKDGNTQNSERIYIKIFSKMLKDMGFVFTEAGSQQSKDFRIDIGANKLYIELKKTDSFTIYFNDTCPSSNIYYIIIFSGKTYKKKKSIKPQIIGVNGQEFCSKSLWIEEYKKDIENLKNKWGRGENAKKLLGPMSVYPRPTYKANIKFLLDLN